MNALGWILVAIAVWLIVSAVAAHLVSRSFRDRPPPNQKRTNR